MIGSILIESISFCGITNRFYEVIGIEGKKTLILLPIGSKIVEANMMEGTEIADPSVKNGSPEKCKWDGTCGSFVNERKRKCSLWSGNPVRWVDC
jgi:hypothetical protein